MRKNNFGNNSPYRKIEGRKNVLFLKMNEKLNPVISYFDFRKINPVLNKKKSELTWSNPHYLFGNTMNSGSLINLKESTVIKLAKIVIQNTDNKYFTAAVGKRRSNDIYFRCLSEISNNMSSAINDNEILLLYLKQIILILKNTSLFNSESFSKEKKNISFDYIQFYLMLLNSFWNTVKWDELFPSMPECAKKLKANKKILLGLMLNKRNKFRLDSISNAFSDITGIGRHNDLFFISFMDFYFFTWLSHFGLVNYIKGNDADPVEIILTENGRKILTYLASE